MYRISIDIHHHLSIYLSEGSLLYRTQIADAYRFGHHAASTDGDKSCSCIFCRVRPASVFSFSAGALESA